jgi:hypothetical protein
MNSYLPQSLIRDHITESRHQAAAARRASAAREAARGAHRRSGAHPRRIGLRTLRGA